MDQWDVILRVGGPLAMLGIAWKAISVLEHEVSMLRRIAGRQSSQIATLYARVGLPEPDSGDPE